MKRIVFVPLLLLITEVSGYGQLKPVVLSDSEFSTTGSPILWPYEKKPENHLVLAARAVAALKQLEKNVLVYRSLGEFETGGKFARVPLEVFNNDLRDVTAEVETILFQLPQSRLRTEIANALSSYRDGEFWWRKVDRPRVVNITAMNFVETRTPSDKVFLSTVPYTVAIHWRHASKYLNRAEKLMGRMN